MVGEEESGNAIIRAGKQAEFAGGPMTNDELNKLKSQHPFQPFRVFTTENESFDVVHPGLIMIGRNGVNIGLPHPSQPPPMASDIVWLDAEDIQRVEPLVHAS
jgi:hypothetical protein